MLRIAIPTTRPQAVANYISALTHLEAQADPGRTFSPDEYDGLLLPGGCDVNPSRYRKALIPQETVDDELDAVQFEVLARFLDANKPVLGICRGHQLLNIVFGGTLVQHLPDAEKHMSLPTGEDNVHTVHLEPDAFLFPYYGADCPVNSSHHQGIDIPGKGLVPVMRSADGVIEAQQHESLPVWSVQWHPERMCFLHQRSDTVDGSRVFRFFLDQCRIRQHP